LNLLLRRWWIARLARALKHVRFSPATGHHTNDRDVFEVSLEVPETKSAFLELCSSLGIVVNSIRPGDNVAQVGTSYKPDVWKTLKFPIPGFPDLAQPGEQTIAGVCVHAWVRGRSLDIVIPPGANPTFANKTDFLRPKAVDDLLSRRSL
jgi:hypothetical protein